MAKSMRSEIINTPEFRVRFANVFTPRVMKDAKPGTPPQYNVTALFDKNTDISKLINLVTALKKKRWGNMEPDKYTGPFKDQKIRTKHSGFEAGNVFIDIKTKDRPGIVTKNSQGQCIDLLEPKDFYDGCYAIASVNAFTWHNELNGEGISFGLINILKTRDGEPLVSRSSPENDFAGITLLGDEDFDTTKRPNPFEI